MSPGGPPSSPSYFVLVTRQPVMAEPDRPMCWVSAVARGRAPLFGYLPAGSSPERTGIQSRNDQHEWAKSVVQLEKARAEDYREFWRPFKETWGKLNGVSRLFQPIEAAHRGTAWPER